MKGSAIQLSLTSLLKIGSLKRKLHKVYVDYSVQFHEAVETLVSEKFIGKEILRNYIVSPNGGGGQKFFVLVHAVKRSNLWLNDRQRTNRLNKC